MTKPKYIPALRFKWLTPLYDFLVGMTMPETKIKKYLIEYASINKNSKVLDLGCGTGTLTIMVKEYQPEANVTGIDVDVQILNKAIEKAGQKGVDIFLIDYDGSNLPFLNNKIDNIISCLVFHHLHTDKKKQILSECFRVLKKHGNLTIADFGRSKSWMQRLLFNIIRGLDGLKSTEANANGSLPKLVFEAGFENVLLEKRIRTLFGEVQIINAGKM